jgi:hypothetical protein
MGARRESLEAARKIRLSPLLSRPDLDALERGLDLLDELCGPLKARGVLDRPLLGPAEVKELTELLPELIKLAQNRDPLWIHHVTAWRLQARSPSEMATRLRMAFSAGYLPLEPDETGMGVPWDVRDLQVMEPVLNALPQQFKRLSNVRAVRMMGLAPDLKALQDLKEVWRRTPDAHKNQVTAQMAAVKNALRVRLVAEPAPATLTATAEYRAIHLPGELLAISKLRGLRGAASLGVLYALSEEHYRVDERERGLFDQKLDRALRRERMAEDPARAYALAVTTFAVSPELLEEKWPKTHTHMLDRFDTSLSAFDGGALLRPAMEALLTLR